MQIVIDIPDEEYEDIIYSEDCGLHRLTRAIANGTPLHKGHGRLIDADAITKDLNTLQDAFTIVTDYVYGMAICCKAPTIIEADKEYEAEVITRGKCMMCGKELTKGLFFCKECGDKSNSGK